MNLKHKDIKCPKCNKNPAMYNEYWSGQVWQFNVVGGVIGRYGDSDEPDPVSVEAMCICGHKWMVEGVNQIVNIT